MESLPPPCIILTLPDSNSSHVRGWYLLALKQLSHVHFSPSALSHPPTDEQTAHPSTIRHRPTVSEVYAPAVDSLHL